MRRGRRFDQKGSGFSEEVGNRNILLTVAVGLNASAPLTEAHGRSWGEMNNFLNEWVITQEFSDHAYVVGAIDIEPAWLGPPYHIKPQEVLNGVRG